MRVFFRKIESLWHGWVGFETTPGSPLSHACMLIRPHKHSASLHPSHAWILLHNRLLAFEDSPDIDWSYEVPVIFLVNLDISWQAYLFWIISISPKRIGPSLAYDLSPFLRTEAWLENWARAACLP